MAIDIKKFTEKVLSRVQEVYSEKYQNIDLNYSIAQSEYQEFGIRTHIVRKLANELYRELKSKGVTDIDEILEYCESLQQLKISELRTIAVQWSFKTKEQFEPKHFTIFENWLKKYVTGWGSTDDLCVQSLGYIVYKFPELIKKVKTWTTSTNQWMRRASAVALIYGLRRGQFLKDAFEIADALFNDKEMYVLKAYGWMLKEAANIFMEDVFNYVFKRKKTMPRLSLRYAIEKMPEEMRRKAMS
ncbi:MAG: DNA alkylation repair protein [Candidatus Heimdallarchaeaceae archaeon]